MTDIDPFKPGSVVQLKSGGPPMTIREEVEGAIPRVFRVDWFDGCKAKQAEIPEVCLRLVENL